MDIRKSIMVGARYNLVSFIVGIVVVLTTALLGLMLVLPVTGGVGLITGGISVVIAALIQNPLALLLSLPATLIAWGLSSMVAWGIVMLISLFVGGWLFLKYERWIFK